MKKCEDIMTRNPVFCAPGDTVQSAAILMKTEEIGPVPVVEGRKVVGIVTDRDLAMKIVAEGRNAKETKVQDVMTRNVVTCRSQDDLQKALDAMTKNQLRRIPVMDNNDQMVGMIAQADVAMHLNEPVKVAQVVKEISRPENTQAGFQGRRE